MSPDSEDQDLVLKARVYARVVYAEHLDWDLLSSAEESAQKVEQDGGSKVEIAAAYLRNSILHKLATIEDIKARFGEEVAALVQKD